MPHASPSISTGAARTPSIAGVAARTPRFSPDAHSSRFGRVGLTYAPRIDDLTEPDLTPDPMGAVDVIVFGSLTEVSAGQTIFFGIHGNLAEKKVKVPMPACVVTAIQLEASELAGAGETFTYTLRKNGIDTGITGTIGGAVTNKATATGSVTFAAGDSADIKLVTSAGAVVAYHTASLVHQLSS